MMGCGGAQGGGKNGAQVFMSWIDVVKTLKQRGLGFIDETNWEGEAAGVVLICVEWWCRYYNI